MPLVVACMEAPEHRGLQSAELSFKGGHRGHPSMPDSELQFVKLKAKLFILIDSKNWLPLSVSTAFLFA